MTDDIIISNLACFGPAEAISRDPRTGCWRLVDYETEEGIVPLHNDDSLCTFLGSLGGRRGTAEWWVR